ncbi:hypothetical protein HYU15_00195 [Candidatus Woesearchaeota archaeon]|nr:hypothetical protein [Candidatus Woesearchaeota archaeon]
MGLEEILSFITGMEAGIYDEIYEGLEKDREHGGEVSRSMRDSIGIVKYVIGASTLAFVAHSLWFNNLLKRKGASIGRRLFITESGLTAAVTALTVHFYSAEKIFGAVYRRNTNEQLSNAEKEEIKADGRTGRAAHYAGTAAIAATFLGMTTLTVDRRRFMTLLPTIATAAFFSAWYYVLSQSYNGLYSASVDYAIGERRQPTNP